MRVGPFEIEILKSIGQGSIGEVFLARSQGPGGFERTVAVKRFWNSVSADRGAIARLERITEAATDINHPNMVEIDGFSQSPEGFHLLVMEYVEGISLRKILDSFVDGGRLLPVALTLEIGRQACMGLHRFNFMEDANGQRLNLAHRGIRPRNLQLTPSGHVKIMDPALVGHPDLSLEMDDSGRFESALNYASPELARGETADTTADQFSIALVMTEMLVGRSVYEAPTLSLMKAEVTEGNTRGALARVEASYPAIFPVLSRALDRDPERRFPDAGAMAMALEKLTQRASMKLDVGRLVRLLRKGEPVAQRWGIIAPWDARTSPTFEDELADIDDTEEYESQITLSGVQGVVSAFEHTATDASMPPDPVALGTDTDSESALPEPQLQPEDEGLPPDPQALTQNADEAPDWDNIKTVQTRAVKPLPSKTALQSAEENDLQAVASSGEKDPYAVASSGEKDPYAVASSGEKDPYAVASSGEKDPYAVASSGEKDPYAVASANKQEAQGLPLKSTGVKDNTPPPIPDSLDPAPEFDENDPYGVASADEDVPAAADGKSLPDLPFGNDSHRESPPPIQPEPHGLASAPLQDSAEPEGGEEDDSGIYRSSTRRRDEVGVIDPSIYGVPAKPTASFEEDEAPTTISRLESKTPFADNKSPQPDSEPDDVPTVVTPMPSPPVTDPFAGPPRSTDRTSRSGKKKKLTTRTEREAVLEEMSLAEDELDTAFFADPAPEIPKLLLPEDSDSQGGLGKWFLAALLLLGLAGYGAWQGGMLGNKSPSTSARADNTSSSQGAMKAQSKVGEKSPSTADSEGKDTAIPVQEEAVASKNSPSRSAVAPTDSASDGHPGPAEDVALAQKPTTVDDGASTSSAPASQAPRASNRVRGSEDSAPLITDSAPQKVASVPASGAKAAPATKEGTAAVPTSIRTVSSPSDDAIARVAPPSIESTAKAAPLIQGSLQFRSWPAASKVAAEKGELENQGRVRTTLSAGRHLLTVTTKDGQEATVPITILANHHHLYYYNFADQTLSDKSREGAVTKVVQNSTE